MKEIKLPQGKVALVDDEDFDFLNQFTWYVNANGNTFYVCRHIYIDGVRKAISMHRTIMDPPKGMQVDHIDHNGLNNQKSNLRICTPTQNIRNRVSHGKSKYIGVVCRNGYIIAQIQSSHGYQYLGSFKTEEEAAVAYDNKAKEIYGEFANLNFKS